MADGQLSLWPCEVEEESAGVPRQRWRPAVEVLNPEGAARDRERRKRRAEAVAGRPRPLVCEVCGDPLCGSRICLDHDHSVGGKHDPAAFRGWAADRCNTILGQARDDPAYLFKLATYVFAHKLGASPEEIRGMMIRVFEAGVAQEGDGYGADCTYIGRND